MILELSDIHLGFGERQHVNPLLQGVSLSLQKGSVSALIGGNGAGKSTLLNVINGFEKRFSGTVKLKGVDVSRWSSHKIAQAGVGRMFQGTQLPRGLTLLESLMLASNDDGWSENPFSILFDIRKTHRAEMWKKERAIAVLEYFFKKRPDDLQRFKERLDEEVTNFSYGEQRIVGFISLLMNIQPQSDTLLLLDEPTSGVNMAHIESMKQVIRDLVETQKVTVLFVEHNMEFVSEVADQCYFLDDLTGKIIMKDAPEKVLSDEEIRKNYLGYEA